MSECWTISNYPFAFNCMNSLKKASYLSVDLEAMLLYMTFLNHPNQKVVVDLENMVKDLSCLKNLEIIQRVFKRFV